jgi:hypothetical protein
MTESEIRRMDAEFAGSLEIDDLMDIMNEGMGETADGCIVEPDGHCPHGHQSALLVLGMI